MKKYFLHLLKKNLLPLACLTLFCVIMYVLPIMVEDYRYWNAGGSYVYLYDGNVLLALGILSVLIPIYLLSYKMNKRSVDMYYALPISRTKILLANYLVGLILLYTSYTFAYWVGFIAIIARVEHLHLVYYVPLYFSSLIPAFMLYTITAFVYTRANTIVDGIITVAGVLFVLSMLSFTVHIVFNSVRWFSGALNGESFFPFNSLSQVSDKFGKALKTGTIAHWFVHWIGKGGYQDYEYCMRLDMWDLVGDIVWFLLAVAATVGLFMTEKNCKAENVGQISESIFSYKVLIPVYMALLTMAALEGEEYTIMFIVLFAAFVLSVIYKRKLKIGWKYAIVLGACVVGAVVLYYIIAAILRIPAVKYFYW